MRTASPTSVAPVLHPAWAPMVLLAMAQTLVVFNITTLQVAIEDIAIHLNAPASSVKTTIVVY